MDSAKYIGMDVHQATISLAVLNSAGITYRPEIKFWTAPSATAA